MALNLGLHRPISKGGKELGGLVRRHELVRDERVICLEHLAGKAARHWLRYEMEIAQHFVEPPATQQADDVWVNICNKQSSCNCGSE